MELSRDRARGEKQSEIERLNERKTEIRKGE